MTGQVLPDIGNIRVPETDTGKCRNIGNTNIRNINIDNINIGNFKGSRADQPAGSFFILHLYLNFSFSSAIYASRI